MNMFKPVKAKSINEYFNNLPPDRKEILEFLHTFIQKTAPILKPVFAYNMPGYGTFKYKNYKGDIIDWPTVSIASQKNYISIYICSMTDRGEYLAEKYKDSLGKVSVGKSCIRFKKLNELNLKTLEEVIQKASVHPGLK